MRMQVNPVVYTVLGSWLTFKPENLTTVSEICLYEHLIAVRVKNYSLFVMEVNLKFLCLTIESVHKLSNFKHTSTIVIMDTI